MNQDRVVLEDFALSRINQASFFRAYEDIMRTDDRIILTSDLFFYSAINLYDSVMILVEKEEIIPRFQRLLAEIHEKSEGMNQNYFEVPLVLMGKLSPSSQKVEMEVDNIEESASFSISPILGVKVDYSQFIPRGHYTGSEMLEKYFKAMMWLSFPKIELQKGDNYGTALKQTRILEETGMMDVYLKIDSLLNIIVGLSDDITPVQIMKCKNFKSPLDSLEKFAQRITPMRGKNKLEYSFFSQKFVIDSYIFQQLTYDYIKGFSGDIDTLPFTAARTIGGVQRVFPRSLDFFAYLGSEKALDVLKKDGDTDYPGYSRRMDSLKKFIEIKSESSLYNQYVMALKELVSQKPFVKPVYQYKNLLTACGGWTELRHSTILYAKQSYTAIVSAPPPEKEIKIYLIEPFPEVYRKLLLFVRNINKIYPEKRTERLISILEKSVRISSEELDGKIPEVDEVKKLLHGLKIITGRNTVPLVADVHTDPNTSTVLEEAIGNPYRLTARINLSGETFKLTGVCYSYYEFKQPMEKRLNDKQWLKMKGKAEPPGWVNEFIE